MINKIKKLLGKINFIKFNIESTQDGELKLRRELVQLKQKYENTQKDLIRELQLTHLIEKRHHGYVDILKKELTYAKNIIKDPILLKKAERKSKFDWYDIYTIKNADAEIHNINKNTKNKAFESFNINNDDIVRTSISSNFNKKKQSIMKDRPHRTIAEINNRMQSLSPRTNFTSFCNNRPRINAGIVTNFKIGRGTPQNLVVPNTFRKTFNKDLKSPSSYSRVDKRWNSVWVESTK